MMRTTRALLGAVILVALAAPAAVSSERSSDRGGSCAVVRVVSPDATSTAKRRSRTRTPSFSASEILDLELQVHLTQRVKGGHAVELRVYTPKGHLYQTLTTAPPAASNPDEAAGRRRGRRPSATAVLPVAGTTIVTSSLYGTWRVEAHLDGNATSCGRPQEFVIEP